MATERTTMIFQLSVDFKEALATFAQDNNIPASEIIRKCVAAHIGYNIKDDDIQTGRPKKYANKEERLEAQRQRQKAERAQVSQLLQDFARAQRRGDVATIEEWLTKRGVPLDE